jgi:hypothetical protein
MVDIIKTGSIVHFISNDIWQISRRFMNFLPSDHILRDSLVPDHLNTFMDAIHVYSFATWSVRLDLSNETAGLDYPTNQIGVLMEQWFYSFNLSRNMPERRISKGHDDLTYCSLSESLCSNSTKHPPLAPVWHSAKVTIVNER